jgi:plastocyanin
MAKELIQVGGTVPFNPKEIVIASGDTIEWKWLTGTHTVTSDNGEFDSGSMKAETNKDVVFEYCFMKKGIFRYHCKLHGKPGGVGMSGTITVK